MHMQRLLKIKLFLFFCKFDSVFTVTFEQVPDYHPVRITQILIKLLQLVIHFKTMIPTFLFIF